MPKVSIKTLLESGVHFGHRANKWDARMKPFIFTERNGIHIIDLQQTVEAINNAYSIVRDVVANGGTVLFVGTKRQAQDTVREEAVRAGMPYVTERWLGGMLTNWNTMFARIQEMERLESLRNSGEINRLTKKESLLIEREITRLNTRLDGVRSMTHLPDLVFIVDVGREYSAVRECNLLMIPIVALVDTNCNPQNVDYVIPSNDDAIRAIKLLVAKVADAVLEGKAMCKHEDMAENAMKDSRMVYKDEEASDEDLLGKSTLDKLAKVENKNSNIDELVGVKEDDDLLNEQSKSIDDGNYEPSSDSKLGRSAFRYTDISYPKTVWLGTPRFSLVVRLTVRYPSNSNKVKKVELKENIPVKVRLHSLSFDVLNEIEQEILTPADRDSPPIVFDLRPVELGPHIITLDFFQNGNPISTVSLPVYVVPDQIDMSVDNSGGGGDIPSKLLCFQPQIPPAIHMLYISYDQFQGGPALTFTLHKSGGVGQTFRPIPLECDLLSYSNRIYERFTVLQEGVEPSAKKVLRKHRILEADDIERRIRNFGQNLWRDIIPQELKSIYSQERKLWHDRTLLIVSDEPFLPWELIWPYGNNWEDTGPWCITTLFARWLRRDFNGNGHDAPANQLAFRSMACLVPTDSDLQAARDEKSFIEKLICDNNLEDLTPNPPSWGKVLDLLENGGYNWIHAAAHGNFYQEVPDGDSAVWLQDGHGFTPQDIVGYKVEAYIKTTRPAFVFNACHAGRLGWALTNLGGWSNRLISTGAGLFIAPLWTVSDVEALLFAKSFYTNLLNKKTIAESVRLARKDAFTKGDPTWLAYTVYAHPNAKIYL